MKQKFQFRSLRTQLICSITLLVLFICIGLSLITNVLSSSALNTATKDSMSKIVHQGASLVNEHVNNYYSQLNTLAVDDMFQDANNNKAQINALLSKMKDNWGYINVFMADTSGIALDNGTDISASEYFQTALSGIDTISDPVINKSDNTMTVFVAVPVKNDNGAVVGVLVSAMDGNILSEIIADVTCGKTGSAYMNNNKGTTIAHRVPETVLAQENVGEMVKTDSRLAQLAVLEAEMKAGKTGTGGYSYNGRTKYMAYCPVENVGWSIALCAPTSEFNEGVNQLNLTIVIVSIIFLIISIIFTLIISKNISDPLKETVNVCNQIAEGDFTCDITTKFLGRKNEIGDIARAFKKILNNMNHTLSNINSSAEQVAVGSKQVSDASVSLSQGATEQASSVEELSASIEQIAAQTKQNAENANHTSSLAEKTKVNADNGNAHMGEMLKAMEEIGTSSNDISKVIKVIDDIAFQTNILSLNAAVEAARAGQYGKGFAVVAEEVRNLATRSASAAKETTAMIESSMKNVKSGVIIAEETAEALQLIVKQVEEVVELVEDIATASNEQTLGINQISSAITQVSSVVQSNSSISEKSAASSEELSGQAEILKQQVAKFTLKK